MAMNPRLLRPTASGFTPKSIAGLQLWLDASDVSTITTDTGVSQWRDKSATGSVWVQTTGNEQPATGTQTLNGRNVLVFDGSDDSLSASAPLNTSMPLTFFVVQRIITGTLAGMTYTAGSGDNFNFRQAGSTAGQFEITAGGTRVHLGEVELSTNRVWCWSVPSGAGNSSTLHRDGTAITISGSATLKPTLTGTHYIGRRSDGFYGNIWVAEILAYSAFLSDVQRKALEKSLGKKWGITVAA